MYGLYAYSKTVVPQEDYSNHYLAALIDKHERLDTLKKNRLVFMGNSNLAFGLDSEYLQETLKRPIANLGLHGALGLDFNILQTLDVIEKGDVVIICIPHFLPTQGTKKLLSTTNKIFPKTKDWTVGLSAYDEFDFAMDDAIKSIQIAKKQRFRKAAKRAKKESVYRRNGFNASGDMVAHTQVATPNEIKKWESEWDVEGYDKEIERLKEFYIAAEKKDVPVYLTYPCFAEYGYKKTQKELDILEDYYAELPFPVLGKPEDFVYPDSLFFDTVYHLNKKGREVWNRDLEVLLKANIKELN